MSEDAFTLDDTPKREAGVADAVRVYTAQSVRSFEEVREQLVNVLIEKVIDIQLDRDEHEYGKAGYPEIERLCKMICKLYGIEWEG